MIRPGDAFLAAFDLAMEDYCVFPCRLDKTPACPHGFKDASTDPTDVMRLWGEHPGVLVGVATGAPSQISVLDIDAKHREGQEWWTANRGRLLPTRTHRTRSGGLHLVYAYNDRVKCSAGKICRGVDTRGDGGYIVWWPAAGLPVLCEGPIAPWPEWLIEALNPPPPPMPTARRKFTACVNSPIALKKCLGLSRTVAQAVEGDRNRLLFWAVCRAKDMLIAGELDQAAGTQLVETLHSAALYAGLTARETTLTIRSALRGTRA
jgi:hypothetical protein